MNQDQNINPEEALRAVFGEPKQIADGITAFGRESSDKEDSTPARSFAIGSEGCVHIELNLRSSHFL